MTAERLVIERLGHRGDGIAPGPVFVPRTLPGEEVEGTVEEGRMPAPRILAPSAERVRPRCRHYLTCGGCAVMHAADPFVAAWKTGIVTEALRAQGLDAPVVGIATSSPNTRRRAALSGRRTKAGALVGLHRRGSDQIVAVPDCHVLAPPILAGLPALEALVAAGGSRKHEMTLRVTASESGLDVATEGGKPLDRALSERLAELAGLHDLARLTWEGEPVAEARRPVIRFAGVEVSPPPGAFLQATEEGQSALIASVAKAIGPAGRVVDLFAGCGTFALPLSRGAEVHAVESDAPALEALGAAWRRGTGLRALTVARRDLFRDPLTALELGGFDAAVIDPPRAGAEAQVTEIARSGLSVVASVSCNPVSFARDARILAGAGFALDWVRVVDQFRWSPHVEIAAAFSR
ncbi:class I SAM-dependent RNA methyltransferase [Palleronia sediminis]|uniref:Class I SAM-dependent RNA methyltransferase n=1 Tax=Palleronia sediminis TaxID=2547833 RepID=A0A4R6A3E9_9RHOB|nr:RsmD family RNA methyltransferase [Palleronia sediminis]TDL78161.1 class I SAM-dependent RNA methyltransferase [Palleronia sediminis]